MSASAIDIINRRRIIQGPSDKLRAISPVKYPWARELWLLMLANNWFPAEVDLTRDINEYNQNLQAGERQMYNRALAFLSNLDAIQLNNLAENISVHITDPTIQQCLYRQVYEEALHVESYSTMVEAMCEDPMEIYDMYRVNPTLKDKNDFVMAQAGQMREEGFSPEQFVYALVSNVVLEGVYFYSGFLAFYTLARMGKMLKSANMIRFINRDELTHLEVFINLWHALRQERPEIFTPEVLENCRRIIRQAVALEAAWGKHIIEGGVLGLTDTIMEDYCQYLGDERARRLGLGVLFGAKREKKNADGLVERNEQNEIITIVDMSTPAENPVQWVDQFSKVNQSEENFFETKVTTYSKRGLSDWD